MKSLTQSEAKPEIRNEAGASPTIVSILDAYNGGDLYPLYLNGLGGSPFSMRGGLITRDLAATYSAVYRCASVIAGTLSTCPLHVIGQDGLMISEKRGGGGSRGVQEARRILDMLNWSFNEHDPSQTTIETIGLDLCLDGNSYLIIERDSMGRPDGLLQAATRGVQIQPARGGRRRAYWLLDERTQMGKYYADTDVVHIAGPRVRSRYGNLAALQFPFGIAPAVAVSDGIRTGLAANRYVGSYFGGQVGGQIVLEGDARLTDEQINEIQARFKRAMASKQRTDPVFLGDGFTAKTLDPSPQTSDLSELRTQQVNEVAMAFGVPPPLLGTNITQWGSGIEHLYRIFLKFCLRLYAVRVKSALTYRLLPKGFRFVFDETELMRGDTQAIARLWMAADGILTVNEARAMAGQTNRPDGDKIIEKATQPNNRNPAPTEDRAKDDD